MVPKIAGMVVALALCIPCAARSIRKVFPATKDSVAAENRRADSLGLPRMETLDYSRLVPVPITCAKALPTERRYALPETGEFLLRLDQEFHIATGKYLIVDSAVRPVSVQRRLARHNRNAAPAEGERASSHERGTTVDLSRKMRKREYRWLLARLAYYKAIGQILVIEERACVHVFVGRASPVSDGMIWITPTVPEFLWKALHDAQDSAERETGIKDIT